MPVRLQVVKIELPNERLSYRLGHTIPRVSQRDDESDLNERESDCNDVSDDPFELRLLMTHADRRTWILQGSIAKLQRE